ATSNSNDLLTGVTNGSYTLIGGSCPADTIALVVSFTAPAPDAQDVPLDSNVVINLTDEGSGIDLSSLIIQINDTLYNSASPEVGITGTANNYTVTINPAADFPDGEPVVVQITGRDVSG